MRARQRRSSSAPSPSLVGPRPHRGVRDHTAFQLSEQSGISHRRRQRIPMRTGGEKYRLCRTCQPLRVGLLARSTLRSDRRHTPRDVLPRSPGGSPQVRRVAAPGCWADGGWQDGGMRANLVRLVCVRRVRRLSDSSRHLARAARQVGRCQASMGVEHPRSAVPALWLSDPPLLCLCLAAEGRRIPHGLSGHQLRAPGLREPVCMPWSADARTLRRYGLNPGIGVIACRRYV